MSVSTAVVLLLEWMETFVDQTVVCSPSTSLRFPSLPIFKLEAESLATRGFSLFATHRIERAGTFLYHSPTYIFLELPGLKNPNSNIPPAETRLWFTESRWDWVKTGYHQSDSTPQSRELFSSRSGMTTAHLVNEAESTLSKLVFKQKVVSSRNHTAEAEKCQGRWDSTHESISGARAILFALPLTGRATSSALLYLCKIGQFDVIHLKEPFLPPTTPKSTAISLALQFSPPCAPP
nr:Copia protein [Ipomoea batatas]